MGLYLGQALEAMVERWRSILKGAIRNVKTKGGEGVANLLLNKVQLSPAAGVFRFQDVDGTVAELRKEIFSKFIEAGAEEAADKSEDSGGSAAAAVSSASVPESTTFKMPSRDFVHTSFLRWSRIDAEKVTDEWERGVASAFEGAVKSHLAKQGGSEAWPKHCSFSRVNLFREDGRFLAFALPACISGLYI